MTANRLAPVQDQFERGLGLRGVDVDQEALTVGPWGIEEDVCLRNGVCGLELKQQLWRARRIWH